MQVVVASLLVVAAADAAHAAIGSGADRSYCVGAASISAIVGALQAEVSKQAQFEKVGLASECGVPVHLHGPVLHAH